jgi:hypothetical protein
LRERRTTGNATAVGANFNATDTNSDDGVLAQSDTAPSALSAAGQLLEVGSMVAMAPTSAPVQLDGTLPSSLPGGQSPLPLPTYQDFEIDCVRQRAIWACVTFHGDMLGQFTLVQ